jgi:DNA repair ATPase RecN
VVTHNPLVASLADRHFVVSKSTGDSRKNRNDFTEEKENTAENHGNAGVEVDSKNDLGNQVDMNRDSIKTERRRKVGLGSSSSSMSTLSEVCGEFRELEISRMATGGGVHSAAGLALARALLGSRGSDRVSSLD